MHRKMAFNYSFRLAVSWEQLIDDDSAITLQLMRSYEIAGQRLTPLLREIGCESHMQTFERQNESFLAK